MTVRICFIAALLVGACVYDDPDLTNAAFKCDTAHPCSSGACVTGVCQPMIVGGGDGVKCGEMQCSRGQQCCTGPIDDFVCQVAGASCDAVSPAVATCDGIEDCTAGQACCGDVQGGAACGSSSCGARVCQTQADCAGGTACHFDNIIVSWGTCY